MDIFGWVISNSVHHTMLDLADIQHTYICTQKLKVLSNLPILWLFSAILAIFCYFCAGYDAKSVLSNYVHHAKLEDMQYAHMCMQNLNVL